MEKCISKHQKLLNWQICWAELQVQLGNFASVDPYHQERGVGGLKGDMNQVKPIWDEFFNNRQELLFFSEQILAEKENSTIEQKYQNVLMEINDLVGETKIRAVKTRVNQSVFRQMVMVNRHRCSVSIRRTPYCQPSP